MFNNLIASESNKKRSVVNWRTLAVSGLSHVALLGGAMYTRRTRPSRASGRSRSR